MDFRKQKDSLKRLGRKVFKSSRSPEENNSEEPENSQAPPQEVQQAPSPASDDPPLSVAAQSQVWNDAYANLKTENPHVVDAYERILSGQLISGVAATSVEGYPDNILATAEDRRDKMAKLIQDGQLRTKRVAKTKENINEVAQPFNQLRSVISLAVKADPTASTAWAGIAVVLDIFVSPLTEPGANRDGIKYILERAQWYWNLSALVLDADTIDGSLKQLQDSLKKSIIKLYEELLLYQMQSVCLYSRSEVAIILRDLVKLDDWQEKIDSIRKVESLVEISIRQLRDEDKSSRLRSLDICLQGVRTDLQTIASVIQDGESQRLKFQKEERDRIFLNQLQDTDPTAEKKAIETLKGGMVKEAHDLVFEHSDFEKLQQDSSAGILWITGDPGSGKTMFLCGIADRFAKRTECGVVSYFFCRADRQQTRTAKAVLRGLLWLICTQSWGITRRLREEYEHKMKTLSEDEDIVAFVNLKDMLHKALSAPSMARAVMLVDAIDECDERNICIILRTIGELSREYPAQWVISTRTSEIYHSFLLLDSPSIEPLYLHLNKEVISRAVAEFVAYSVKRLSRVNGYSSKLEDDVEGNLCSKAGDTFLWVALVCLELERLGPGDRHVRRILAEMPEGLTRLYERMFRKAVESVDGDVCRQILQLASVTYRPLALNELQTLVPEVAAYHYKDLRAVVGHCGSFLSLQGHMNDLAIATFVHESAREYLIKMTEGETSTDEITHQRRLLLHNSLSNMKKLTRNIYQLPSPGTAIDEVTKPEPDALLRLCYSGHYWLDHANYILHHGKWEIQDNDVLEEFICHDLLHWIEMLSLTRNMARSTAGFQQFNKSFQANRLSEIDRVSTLVEQARRFILYNKSCIEHAPLQVYVSALLFCPQQSMGEIKNLYQHELQGITAHPENDEETNSFITQELRVPCRPSYMSFSPDGNFLAAGHNTNERHTIPKEPFLEVWDMLASQRIVSVKIRSRICDLTFSKDGTQLFAALGDGTVDRFAAESGILMGSIRYPSIIIEAFFSPNSALVALRICIDSLVIMDVHAGTVVCSITVPLLTYSGLQLRFAPDTSQMAVASTYDSKIVIWSTDNWQSSLTIPLEGSVAGMTYFGTDKVAVGIGYNYSTVSIISTLDGSKILNIPCYSESILESMAWLGSGLSYMCLGNDHTMRIYDDTGINCVQSFPELSMPYSGQYPTSNTFAISTTSQLLALAGDQGIRIWNLNMKVGSSFLHKQSPPEIWLDTGVYLAFSSNRNDRLLLAFVSENGVGIRTLQCGDVTTILTNLPFMYHGKPVFSPNGETVASQGHGSLQFRNTADSTVSHERKLTPINDLSFSPDSTSLAVACGPNGVLILDVATNEITGIIPCTHASRVVYSHNGIFLAIADLDSVQVWLISPVQDIHYLYSCEIPPSSDVRVSMAFSPDDQSLVIVIDEEHYRKGWFCPDKWVCTGEGICAEKYERVLIWRLGESRPRFMLPWYTGIRCRYRWMSTTISPDGDTLAIARDDCVWVWNLLLPATTKPLTIFLSHRTRNCCFDSDGMRLRVDGGAVLINFDRRQLEYTGYGLNEDCTWVTKNNQNLLYLTQDFRPGHLANDESFDGVVFMDSTLAVVNQSERIQILRFHDELDVEDRRWIKE